MSANLLIRRLALLVAVVGASILMVGEPEAQGCHPNYQGACLDPNASDYDCAGQGGNGPLYVETQVTVVGDDPYGLDDDNDGIGCDLLPATGASQQSNTAGQRPSPSSPNRLPTTGAPTVAIALGGLGLLQLGGALLFAGRRIARRNRRDENAQDVIWPYGW